MNSGALARPDADEPTPGRIRAAFPALVMLTAVVTVRGGLGIASGWSQTRLEPRLRQEAERSLFEVTTAVPLAAFDAEGFVDDLERGAGRGVDAVWTVVRNARDAIRVGGGGRRPDSVFAAAYHSDRIREIRVVGGSVDALSLDPWIGRVGDLSGR